MRKPLLLGMHPMAIVTDIPVSLRKVDGLPVIPLNEAIKNKDDYRPIIICIRDAQACARKLKALYPDYPDEYIIGFGFQ